MTRRAATTLLTAAATLVAAHTARRRLLLVTVRGASMSPALVDGDRVLVVRRQRICVGDVVLLDLPLHHGLGPFLKRVIAVAGDCLPLDVPLAGTDGRNVPPGQVVVKGDHVHSLDSRLWGCLRLDQVQGVAVRQLHSERL